ncbi:MAG: DUF6138 family protein [Oscillospiraceae bacterium]|nr:DUF6138 family protein [Oscillospiraceae bacterium]
MSDYFSLESLTKLSELREYLREEFTKKPDRKFLYDDCVNDILDDKADIVNKYPIHFKGSKLHPDYVFTYFLWELDKSGFDFEKAHTFSEKMRNLLPPGGELYYHFLNPLRDWVEFNIREPFFYATQDKNNAIMLYWHLKEDKPQGSTLKDKFKFACYTALCHKKYGANDHSLTTEEIFDWLTALGSDLPAKLKKHGSGDIPKEVSEYKDPFLTCVSNDAFATIRIVMKEDSKANYEKVLDFLIQLLKTEFPRSYSIDFRSSTKNYLPIKKLPKKGVNQLFANAVQHSELHDKIKQYAQLAMKEFEWYNNLEAEHCAMPGTFAVFALGLLDEAYHKLVVDYIKICDGEHQSVHGEFVLAYIEKFGFTEKGMELYALCEGNIQELPKKLLSLCKKMK